ncbi:protein phosphatase 2C domain-containing protein [Selenomonas sp. AB3002]|uniref:protein phosphatase 2C domain-containing protein n=1 Tax=Selenomonas sp. AB3002 TaxID=1392502 RepID=UPI000496BA83
MPYRIFSLSRPGEKYARRGFRCQDSSGTCTKNGIQIVAVADGHGADDCFRSEIGASIAIDTLIAEALPLLYEESLPFSEQGIKSFKYKLWQSWREVVRRDWDSKLAIGAIGDNEPRYEFVSEKYRLRYQNESKNYLYTAYGTTLLAAIAIENELLLIQIGDGSAVVLCANGLFDMPVPQDEENYLNVTTSLSDENADQKIRHAVLSLDKGACNCPVSIFLSTDGVDDCFPAYKNEEYLFKFYKVLAETAIREGTEALFDELARETLSEMSAKGSHDDISLGLMVTDDKELLQNAFESISLPQSIMDNEETEAGEEE